MTPLSRLQAALVQQPFDALLISSEINQRYLSDFVYSDGFQLITKDAAFLFTDKRYEEAAKAQVEDFIVLVPDTTQTEAISRVIRDNGFRTVAIEEQALSYADYQRFQTAFPCEVTVGASALLSDLRRIKSPEELEKIARSQVLTDLAFDHILHVLESRSPSLTERDVALELEYFMRQRGAEGVAFDTIAVSGSASSRPHGEPRDIPLQQGFLTMDFGAKRDGYCSDMTRTVVIGHADEEMKRVYQTVLNAQRAALDFLAEGVRCRDVDHAARQVITDAGYGAYFTHSLGHGIGMLVHEAPGFSRAADSSSLLCRGHVLSVEPGIYLEGRFGVRIEDMIAVEHDGTIRNFTKSPKELLEL